MLVALVGSNLYIKILVVHHILQFGIYLLALIRAHLPGVAQSLVGVGVIIQ
jgi:hypothetical protein